MNKIFFKVENNFGNGRTVGRKLEDNLFLLSFMNIIFYFIFDIFIYCLNTLNPGKSSGFQFFFQHRADESCRLNEIMTEGADLIVETAFEILWLQLRINC